MHHVRRQKHLLKVTRMLVLMTATTLAVIALALYVLFDMLHASRTFLMVYVFTAGLVGGFVSLQQRLPTISLEELEELSQSWPSILLVPINGGIFAIVLHLVFVAGLLEGTMFPRFVQPEIVHDDLLASISRWLTMTFPATGQDFAKLLFWCFTAGFSERLVPQIIRRASEGIQEPKPEVGAPRADGARSGADTPAEAAAPGSPDTEPAAGGDSKRS